MTSVHYATVVCRNKCIVSKSNGRLHAEVAALKAVREEYKKEKLVLYVTRVSKNGHLNSRPCLHCSKFIKKAFPKLVVYYTTETGIWTKDEWLDNTHICGKFKGF